MEFLILDEGTGLTKAGVRFAERKTAADYIRQNQMSGVVVWPVGGTIFNVEMWADGVSTVTTCSQVIPREDPDATSTWDLPLMLAGITTT